MKAAIYARVSTVEQEPENQLLAWAQCAESEILKAGVQGVRS